MTVQLFYTDTMIKVIGGTDLLVAIACAVGHEVRFDNENTLVTKREEHTLDVIRGKILRMCDIESSVTDSTGNITRTLIYCLNE